MTEYTRYGEEVVYRIYEPEPINYEEKTLEELKEIRKSFHVMNVYPHGDREITAYLIRMIDILLDMVEKK